ncbi:adhesin [Enterobacteriales bacterium SAP-6]|uniref:Adhesin n=1 Tax=Acerihabitans arboris TaxID=2691583 RepID=A0A845STH8_9GAMM|nr:adhesin [Acerihabitans arboris]
MPGRDLSQRFAAATLAGSSSPDSTSSANLPAGSAIKHTQSVSEGVGGKSATVAGAAGHGRHSGLKGNIVFAMGDETCEGTREQCAVRDGTRKPERMESRDKESGGPKPNLGKAIGAEKAELGGVGSVTPGGWGPDDEQKGYDKDSQKQHQVLSNDKGSSTGQKNVIWDSWQNHSKTIIRERQYAQIGDRLYAQHAVDRIQPSGLVSPAGTVGPGRNITPNMVEHVIKTGSPQTHIVNGVTRTTYWSGDVGVVTENSGKIVVIILRRSGK